MEKLLQFLYNVFDDDYLQHSVYLDFNHLLAGNPCSCVRPLGLLLLEEFPRGGGGYFLVKGYWGCAAAWGRIFTTGLTIMHGVTFVVELLEWIAHFRDFWGKKF